MGLNSLFRQRRIGKKYTSFRGLIPLRTPSGEQETESALESDLIVQLNFSLRVVDLITQPIIEYTDPTGRDRQYTPDAFVELQPEADGAWRYYLIEAKLKSDLEENGAAYQIAFDAARDWCAKNYVHFRIVTEDQIRTPYLTNALLLSHHLDHDPEEHALEVLWSMTDSGPARVSAVIKAMHSAGIQEPDARDAIERAVANRFVACDLSRKFDDDSILFNAPIELADSNDRDPILKLIRTEGLP